MLYKKLWFPVYALLCIELSSKVVLFLPWVTDRFGDTAAEWRIRWIQRHIGSGRQNHAWYGFDVYDPLKGWALRPNLVKYANRLSAPMVVSSNSRGMRSTREFSFEKKPGIRRILFLGDSFTFGDGLTDEEVYPSRLQSLLGQQAEVLNLAIHGYGHDQMLLQLEKEGVRYRPDIVVLGFYGPDMIRNVLEFRDYAKPRFVLRKGSLVLRNVPVPTFRQVLGREFFRLHAWDVASILFSRLAWVESRRQKESEIITAALLDGMREACAKTGARFVLVYLPTAQEIPAPAGSESCERFLMDYAHSRGVPLCNLHGFLKRTDGGRYSAYSHYDAFTHARIAGELRDFLKPLI